MNIGMVLPNSFPPDIRVEKEARCLIEQGHKVFLLAYQKNGQLKEENVNGIHVVRVSLNNSVFWRVYRYGQFSIFKVHPQWKKHIQYFIDKFGIEILHIHDLPLVNTGITAAKRRSIPVIADLHENYAEAVKAWNSGERSILTKIIELPLSPSRWNSHAKKVLHKVNHIIAVINEGKEYYHDNYKIPNDRITVIMNTEDLNFYDSIEIKDEVIGRFSKKYIISYIGGFGPHRGIDTAIRAMPNVIKAIPHAQLLLVGGKGSPKFESEIHALIKDLHLEDHVHLTGWVDFSLVPSYIVASSVCLVPHHASGHTNSTIPHKLFQYMAMKKPIVTTDCIPLKRIVEETQSGIVVPSGDANGMANAIIELYNYPDRARQYGENGRRAVEMKYNWKNEAKKLIDLYQRFIE